MNILTFVPLKKGFFYFSDFLPNCSFIYHVEMVKFWFQDCHGIKIYKDSSNNWIGFFVYIHEVLILTLGGQDKHTDCI